MIEKPLYSIFGEGKVEEVGLRGREASPKGKGTGVTLPVSSGLFQELEKKFSLSLETKRLIREIESEIDELDWNLKEELPLHAGPRLWEPAKYLLLSGGKRVRPLLMGLLAKTLNLEFDQKLRSSALAAELVHTATLLHDDIIDGARVRRGRLAAHLKYDAHSAILAGDAFLTKAISDMATYMDKEVILNLSLTLREILEGECLQADMAGTVHEDLDAVLEVCRRKTSSLFSWCCWVVGHCAQSSATELKNFGSHMGLAFQLLDDVLDWESGETGKVPLKDLAEAKLNTVSVVLCMKSKEARQLLKKSFSQLNEHKEVANVQELGVELRAYPEYAEAITWVKVQAEKESQFALANIETLPDSPWKEAVKNMTLHLLSRMR